MTAGRDPDRLIQAYLEEGLNELPDRAYDAVRSEIDHTRQRVVIGPWRFPTMSNFARYGVAAAAVVLVALLGIKFLPLGGVGPGSTTAPTAVPTASPLPPTTATKLPEGGELAPGTYYIEGAGIGPVRRLTFTVPAGWIASDASGRRTDSRSWDLLYKDPSGPGGIRFMTATVDSVYADICQWRGTHIDGGTTADQLVAALGSQTGGQASAPTATSIGGFAAKQTDLTTPDTQGELCNGGNFHYWPDPPPNGDLFGLWSAGAETNTVYAVDIPGSRSVLAVTKNAETTLQDLAELDTIIASVKIEP